MASENALFEHFSTKPYIEKYMSHQKMDQLVGFLLHPPLSEIVKKLGKMLRYIPTSKVLSAPLMVQAEKRSAHRR